MEDQDDHDGNLTTSTWTVDSAHSSTEFSVKHMMVSTVKGRFRDVTGR